jgi:ATP-dependent Zn protease
MAFWDRCKFLLGLVVAFFILVWSNLASFDGIMTFPEAVNYTAADRWGLVILLLIGVEVLRQLHFLVSERSPGYHRLWTKGVFGGFDRWTHRRFSDWTRYRLSRWLKVLFWVLLIAIVLGAVMETNPILALFQAPAFVWQLMPFVLQLGFAFFFVIFQFVGLFWFLSRGGVDTYFPDDIKTRFSDVWGQDHVVERVKENIVFLEKPDEIEAKGGYVPSGLLLWGPPGTGKTLMAEAVAGETGKPYVFVDPGAFINMFMGIGVLKVKSLFRKLRKLALRYGGVIVFFDEADSLGRRGALAQQGPPGAQGGFSGATSAAFCTDGCHGYTYLSEDTRSLLMRSAFGGPDGDDVPVKRNRFFMGGGMNGGGGDMGTLQALLTELSGLKKPRGFVNRYVRRLLGMRPKPPPKYRILVMMATNMPNSLDEALLRPGRIDRIYKVGYPSKAGRIRTYKGYFAKVKHELTDEQIDKLATITPYATGATIKDLVNESLITAIRDGRDVISWYDVTRAKRLKQLGPSEDVEYIERERHAVAVHEACHAVAAYRTRLHLEIDLATIEKGADYLGMVSSIKPEDQFTRWKSEHEADIMVSLASLAGERMFFGDDNSSGVSGDLVSATYLVGLMEAHWGMGEGIAALPALAELGIAPGSAQRNQPKGGSGIGFLGDPNKKSTGAMQPDRLSERVEFNLVRLMEKTEELLRENRREVLTVAHALETHKTLNGDDVVAIIEGSQGPLVDGTVYASDEFFARIEAYHEDAVRAHREHAKVTTELPVPPEIPGVDPAMVVQGVVTESSAPTGPLPVLGGPAPVALAAPPVIAPPANGNGHAPAPAGGQPDFMPWNGNGGAPEPPAYGPYNVGAHNAEAEPPARSGAGRVWAVVAAIVALVAVVLLGLTAISSGGQPSAEPAGPDGGMSTGTLLILLVAVVGVIGGVVIAYLMLKAQQAARTRAESARDRAAERAQLLAAAMDPDQAMRLLGYGTPNGPTGPTGPANPNGQSGPNGQGGVFPDGGPGY